MATEKQNRDWELDENDDLKIPLRFVSGKPAVRQRLKIRLRTFFAEVFFAEDAGVRWYDTRNADGTSRRDGILGNKYDPVRADGELRAIILDTEDVISVLEFSSDFDSAERVGYFTYKIASQFGIIEDEVEITV